MTLALKIPLTLKTGENYFYSLFFRVKFRANFSYREPTSSATFETSNSRGSQENTMVACNHTEKIGGYIWFAAERDFST